MIWNKAMECSDRDTMNRLQLRKLQATIKRVYQNVEPYRLKMQSLGLKPGDIQSLDDIKKLPFTTKSDLRDAYPYGMFLSPLNKIVRIRRPLGMCHAPLRSGGLNPGRPLARPSRRDEAVSAQMPYCTVRYAPDIF